MGHLGARRGDSPSAKSGRDQGQSRYVAEKHHHLVGHIPGEEADPNDHGGEEILAGDGPGPARP